MSSRGIFFLTLATLAWGVLQVIDKAALNKGVEVPSYTISRVFIAMIVSAVFLGIQNRHHLKMVIAREHLRDLMIVGLLASGVGLLLQIVGLSYTTATNMSAMLTLIAPITSVFAWLVLRESITKRFICSSLLMLFGVWLTRYHNELAPFGIGDALVLLAIVGYAYSNVHARKTMKNVPADVVTVGRLFFGWVSLALLLPFLGISFSSLASAPFLVILGGVVFGIRVVSYYKGIEAEGAATAATALLFSTVVTMLIAHLVLDEPITLPITSGIGLVVIGGMLLTTARSSAS